MEKRKNDKGDMMDAANRDVFEQWLRYYTKGQKQDMIDAYAKSNDERTVETLLCQTSYAVASVILQRYLQFLAGPADDYLVDWSDMPDLSEVEDDTDH